MLKRHIGTAVAIAAMAVLATPVAADQQPAATAPAATTAAQPVKPPKKVRDPNAVVCRTIPEPGSRLGGTKTCMTRAQWDEQARDSASRLSEFQASHTSTGAGGH